MTSDFYSRDPASSDVHYVVILKRSPYPWGAQHHSDTWGVHLLKDYSLNTYEPTREGLYNMPVALFSHDNLMLWLTSKHLHLLDNSEVPEEIHDYIWRCVVPMEFHGHREEEKDRVIVCSVTQPEETIESGIVSWVNAGVTAGIEG